MKNDTPGNTTRPAVLAEPGASPAPPVTSGTDGAGAKFIHDMRNAIAPIHNVVQILRLRGATDPQLLTVAGMIDRQLQTMSKLLAGVNGVHSAGESEVKSAVGRALPDSGLAHAHRRVLIADDNSALRASFSSLLQELGREVRTAADGEEAILLARDWKPGFVFIDINMPKMNGYDVARRLRAMSFLRRP